MTTARLASACLLSLGLALAACGSNVDGNPDAGSIGCEGCLDDQGNCQLGSLPQQCGHGGILCGPCDIGDICPAGTCETPASCGPDNCSGCCDSSGICNDVPNDSACGKSGASCQICGDDASCVEGTCVGAACASDCAGCCTGTDCGAGTADDACGKDGGACADCGASGTCQDGACVIDPTSHWTFTVVSAVVPPEDEGSAWDISSGLPDPIIELVAGDAEGETTIQDDTVMPTWNEVVLDDVTAAALQGTITITVSDDDIADDDLIASCTTTMPAGAFDGSLYQVSCASRPDSGNPPTTIDFRLAAKP